MPIRSWCGVPSVGSGSSTSGWPSPRWSSSLEGSFEKDGVATAGRDDLAADRSLLAEALRRDLRPRVEAFHKGTTILVPNLVILETSDLLDAQLIQPFAYLANVQRIVF